MIAPIDGLMVLALCAMVALTFAVAVLLFVRRSGEMRTRRIHPQAVASAKDMFSKLEDNRAADNFRNLFETPLLFYAGILAAIAVHAGSWTLALLAWLYVVLRILHSLIHCTYNKVMHRMFAFTASMAVLAVIWCMVAARAAVIASQ